MVHEKYGQVINIAWDDDAGLIYASFFCQRGHCVVYFWLVKEVDSLGEGVR